MNKELKYLIEKNIDIKYELNNDHIFILGAHANTLEKEIILVRCIKKLKEFNVPIILSTHYQIRPEIQNLVDYFICDNKNELLYFNRFSEFNINSLRWTETDNYIVNNYHNFHHDFAALTIIKNGVILSKELGKSKIHYIDYDSIIDSFQFHQTFMRDINYYDVVYGFLFSINIDVAEKIFVDEIKTLDEHFKRPDWRFEDFFSNGIKKYSKNPKESDYLNNDKSFNIIAAWSRAGINRYGAFFDVYLCVNNDDLYIHLYSKTSDCNTPTSASVFKNLGIAEKDYLIEIKYKNFNKFHSLILNSFDLINIGKYIQNEKVEIKYMGHLVFEEQLNLDLEKFRKMNNLIFK